MGILVDKNGNKVGSANYLNAFQAAKGYKILPDKVSYADDSKKFHEVLQQKFQDTQLKPQQLTMSPWMDEAIKSRQDATTSQLGTLGQQTNTAMQSAQDYQSMRGGLSGSAANRIAERSAENAALNRQNIMGQGASDVLGLQQQKEDMQQQIDKYNAAQKMDSSAFNTQNAIQSIMDRNAANKFKYMEDMRKYGSEQSANAMKNNSGKK